MPERSKITQKEEREAEKTKDSEKENQGGGHDSNEREKI